MLAFKTYQLRCCELFNFICWYRFSGGMRKEIDTFYSWVPYVSCNRFRRLVWQCVMCENQMLSNHFPQMSNFWTNQQSPEKKTIRGYLTVLSSKHVPREERVQNFQRPDAVASPEQTFWRSFGRRSPRNLRRFARCRRVPCACVSFFSRPFPRFVCYLSRTGASEK